MTAKRVPGGLDPHPSTAELRTMYERKTGQSLTPLELPLFVRHEVPEPRRLLAPRTAAPGILMLGNALTASRDGDALVLRLDVAPRTKKNHGRAFGIKQSTAYVTYRTWIVRAIAGVQAQLGLPLPPRPYNIAATYYVDPAGEQADKCGLDQGLYDALENAGVIPDDWYFRRDDGTRIVAGDPHPRVECIITPIEEEA